MLSESSPDRILVSPLLFLVGPFVCVVALLFRICVDLFDLFRCCFCLCLDLVVCIFVFVSWSQTPIRLDVANTAHNVSVLDCWARLFPACLIIGRAYFRPRLVVVSYLFLCRHRLV